MERNDLGHAIVTTAADLDAMDWTDSPQLTGVRQKVLWQAGTTVLGIMEIDEGAANTEHTHHAAHHHMLMLSGTCTMLDRELTQGAYAYIPPGVPHAAVNTGSGPCRFFFTYRPVEVEVADDPLVVV